MCLLLVYSPFFFFFFFFQAEDGIRDLIVTGVQTCALPIFGADNPHDLMRAMEAHFIRDCAEMAARASLYRTESRWGLYHYRVDYPEMRSEERRVGKECRSRWSPYH